ncbi:MAG: cbb3-type cytochrome oxidase assembly protein CcoS [Chlamydiales bacterium]
MILALIGGAIGLIIFIFCLRKGQFEDLEDTKYQIFWEDDDA